MKFDMNIYKKVIKGKKGYYKIKNIKSNVSYEKETLLGIKELKEEK